jgi:hypothetical protein
VAGAGEADTWAVGEESAALGAWTDETNGGGGSAGERWLPFKGGRQGTTERGDPAAGMSRGVGADMGPGSDGRAAPRPRLGRGAPLFRQWSADATDGWARLAVGEGVRSGARVGRPEKEGGGLSRDE